MKKVLLVVIDALSSRVIPPAIETGDLPTFRRLCDAGVLRESCTSIFPSITPAATASIVTGCYPSEHRIAGNFWFDRDRDSVAYYGDDFRVIFNAGFGKFFDDYLLRLNFQRLAADLRTVTGFGALLGHDVAFRIGVWSRTHQRGL